MQPGRGLAHRNTAAYQNSSHSIGHTHEIGYEGVQDACKGKAGYSTPKMQTISILTSQSVKPASSNQY